MNKSTLVKLLLVINMPLIAVSATAGSLVGIIT
jgi:type III secretory pathway component EscS